MRLPSLTPDQLKFQHRHKDRITIKNEEGEVIALLRVARDGEVTIRETNGVSVTAD